MFKKIKRITMSFIAVLLFITVFSVGTEVNATGEGTVADIESAGLQSDGSIDFVFTVENGVKVANSKGLDLLDETGVRINGYSVPEGLDITMLSNNQYAIQVYTSSQFRAYKTGDGDKGELFLTSTTYIFDVNSITCSTFNNPTVELIENGIKFNMNTSSNKSFSTFTLSGTKIDTTPKFNVSFTNSLSEVLIDTIEIEEGTNLVESDIPTAAFVEGKVFEFWAQSIEGEVAEVAFDYANTPINAGITLTAIYRDATPEEVTLGLIEQFQLLNTKAKLGISYHYSGKRETVTADLTDPFASYGNFKDEGNISSQLKLNAENFSILGTTTDGYGPSFGTKAPDRIRINKTDTVTITSIEPMTNIIITTGEANASNDIFISDENDTLLGTITSDKQQIELNLDSLNTLKLTASGDYTYLTGFSISTGLVSYDKQKAELGFISREITDSMVAIDGASFGIAYIKGEHDFVSEEDDFTGATYLPLTPGQALDDSGNEIAGMNQIGLKLKYRAEGETKDRKAKYKDVYSVAVYMQIDGKKYFMQTKTSSIKDISREYMESTNDKVKDICKQHAGILNSLKNYKEN